LNVTSDCLFFGIILKYRKNIVKAVIFGAKKIFARNFQVHLKIFLCKSSNFGKTSLISVVEKLHFVHYDIFEPPAIMRTAEINDAIKLINHTAYQIQFKH